MAFTRHRNPHHVQRADGTWAHRPHPEHRHLTGYDCAEGLVQLEDGSWPPGGQPDSEASHHVEIDVSTGMTGYTRMTEKDLAAHRAEMAAANRHHEAQVAAARTARRKRLKAALDKAATDPAMEAVLRELAPDLLED